MAVTDGSQEGEERGRRICGLLWALSALCRQSRTDAPLCYSLTAPSLPVVSGPFRVPEPAEYSTSGGAAMTEHRHPRDRWAPAAQCRLQRSACPPAGGAILWAPPLQRRPLLPALTNVWVSWALGAVMLPADTNSWWLSILTLLAFTS